MLDFWQIAMYADVVRAPRQTSGRTASRLVKSGQGINLPGFLPFLCQWPISKVFRASVGQVQAPFTARNSIELEREMQR